NTYTHTYTPKANLWQEQSRNRLTVFLENLLMHCFWYPKELYVQDKMTQQLTRVNQLVRRWVGKDKLSRPVAKQMLSGEIAKLNELIESKFKKSFTLPLNPTFRSSQLLADKCSFFGSAQVPLRLACKSVDTYSDDLSVIFKAGDDLRQDILTLQIMSIMDQASLWLYSGKDLRLRIYEVVATGKDTGFIELVTNSETVNSFSVKMGGWFDGPQDVTTHFRYLLQHNHDNLYSLLSAQDRFIRSCAGCVIASWVLGIGDRHPDNYMIHQTDIDFGHFLGNFKFKTIVDFKKLGIHYRVDLKRELSPFVFLPAMKYAIKIHSKDQSQLQNDPSFMVKTVEYPQDFSDPLAEPNDMDNVNYQEFIDNCRVAYNVVRKRDRLFFTLLRLMIPSQMPELLREVDIDYMKKMLHLEIERDEEIKQLVEKEERENKKDTKYKKEN
ncbi:phosphatidylinositol-4,5-diphosphate 3-kinase, partial [Reticulomyxa filosa]